MGGSPVTFAVDVRANEVVRWSREGDGVSAERDPVYAASMYVGGDADVLAALRRQFAPDAAVAVVPPAPRNDEQIRRVGGVRRREDAVRDDAETLRRGDDLLVGQRHERDVAVGADLGGRPEHLVGADGVEFVETVEDRDLDTHTWESDATVVNLRADPPCCASAIGDPVVPAP